VVVVVACAAAGGVFALAYDRWSEARAFTSLVAVAAIVSPLMFLFDPRVASSGARRRRPRVPRFASATRRRW
jgi:hypothetical protein